MSQSLYSPPASETDVIIIGSGLSALQAARTLTARGHAVVLLEARNRIGGRAYTHTEGVEQPVDLGCAQVHGWEEGNPVRRLAGRAGVSAHVVQGAELVVIGAEGPLAPTAATTLLAASRSSSYTPSSPPPRSSASLASVLLPTLPSPELLALARTTEIGAGVPLEDLSAKYWGFGRGFGGTDAAPVGGYTSLVHKLWQQAESAGATLHLGEEVVGIEDLGEGGVKVTTESGKEWLARAAISTIPLGVLKVSPPTFSPELPAAFLAAIQRTAVGVLEKVVLSYSTPWWPSPSTIGTFLILPSSPSASPPSSLAELFTQTTLSVTNLHRTAHVPHASLLIYLGANAGRFIASHSESDVGEALHTYLSTRLSVPGAPSPKNIVVSRWLEDAYARGATSSPVTLARSSDGEGATPLDFVLLGRSQWGGRLGFAGEHTDLDGRGSVVGAVVSGEREGERVAGMLERARK